MPEREGGHGRRKCPLGLVLREAELARHGVEPAPALARAIKSKMFSTTLSTSRRNRA